MSCTDPDRLKAEVDRLRARVAQLQQELAARRENAGPPEGEAPLRKVLQFMPVMLDAFDAQGNIVMWNRECERVTGYSAEEIVGNPNAMSLLYPDPEYLERMMAQWAAHGDDYYNWEWQLTCKDGSQRTIAWSNIARRVPVPGWATWAIGVDVTERKKAEQALRDSHERARVIAEATAVPITITRLSDDRVIYANSRAREDFGSERPLIGQRAVDFFQDPADRRKLLDRLQQDGRVRDFELGVKRKDGSVGYVSISLQPITFEGEPAVLSAFLDITRVKEAEASLLSERRLLRRSLHLLEREHQLTAYEIHDGLVQDLTAAIMFLQSLGPPTARREQAPNETLAKAIRLVQHSIAEARRLINGLRPPVLEDQGIIAAVQNLIEETEVTAGLSVDLQHDVGFERLDPAIEMAIYRIVQEAVNNVWKHSRSKRARVQLIQREQLVQIAVEDWGIGFELSSVPRKSYGLRGIRERAKLLGGTARIQSRPGQGTKICVDLPMTALTLPDDDPWDR